MAVRARAPVSTFRAARSCRLQVVCQATRPQQATACALGAAAAALAFNLVHADMAAAAVRLPPLDNDPNRCDRGYVGNTIGQANAVSDRTLDMRLCDYTGANLSGKVLAGALMSDANLSGTNLQEAVLTKAYAVGANFQGSDMTNAVVDRVAFDNANLRDVKFINTVVTGATFEGADLTGSIWEEAIIGAQDVTRLCDNPTLVGESRMQVGCRVPKTK